MASASQGHSAFPPRGAYPPSSKLPDRTALNNNPPPFGASSLSRRPDQSQPALDQHRGAQAQKEVDYLDKIEEDQRQEIGEAFTLFDLDHDKHLDYHELRVALRALGFSISKPELIQILNEHGVPRKGKGAMPGPASRSTAAAQDPPPHPSQLLIPQAAFAQVAARYISLREPREEIERAFELFDSNQKGYIDLEDLRRVARELQETDLDDVELRAMIEEFDLEGRGYVSKEDFIAICSL